LKGSGGQADKGSDHSAVATPSVRIRRWLTQLTPATLCYKSCVMPSTRKGSIQLFRFAGIDVFLHWSWFVVAAFEISARGRRYPSIAWNIAEYLALFIIVTLHEFGHALACRQVGGTANKIVLWPLGGVAYVDPPPRPAATLWSIAAGPLVNVVLLGISSGLALWARHVEWRLTAPHAYKLLWAVCFMNLGLLVFNLLPIYPLDGGQILRALLWFVMGRARSLKVVAVLGLLGAAGLIVVAFWLHSFWIGLISLYMLMNCWTGLQRAQILSRLESPPPALRGRLGEEYTEITDPNIQSRVRARHSSKIASLQGLGFQHFAFRLEALPPYSAISKLPIVLMMLSKEVLVFPKPARLGVANILLTHSSPSSIAEITGLGIKFYSVFMDGTLMISSTYRSPLAPGSNCRIIKNPHCQTAEEAWLTHKQKAAELGTQALTLRNLSSFADYVEIEKMKLGMVAEA
jgi:Zn-dependent protease